MTGASDDIALARGRGVVAFAAKPRLVNPTNVLKPGFLYRGDNLDVLRQMPDASADLIYLDPPFFSNRNYEVIWGDEAEIRSFADRWDGGIENYVDWMEARCREMHRVLAPTGSFYLHCDQHAGHYLKVMLDAVFERRQFRNEIIWSYKRYTAAANRFQRLHDTLLFYGKDAEVTFNVLREPYGDKSGKADSHYRQDEDGRWFRWQKRKGKEPYKVYLSEGRRLGDVWEIPTINASARERLGYPTQKPKTLMERIILSSSNPGDMVLDPFCGCGTTLDVAEEQQRNWVGIDISPTAIDICEARLAISGAKVTTRGMPGTVADLHAMRPFEFQHWVCHQLQAVPSPTLSGDRGLDGRMSLTHDPVQVKQKQVGRPDVDAFITAIERAGSDRGVMVGFGHSRDAREEIKRIKRRRGIEISLHDAADLLVGARKQQIVQELQPAAEQLTLDQVLFSRIPKERPTADDLIASELAGRAEEMG